MATANLSGWLPSSIDTGPFDFRAAGGIAVARRRYTGFGEWMADARSDCRWDAPHFREMQRVLDMATVGQIRRVFFQVAIRHGKTEHNSEGYGSYRIEMNPRLRVLVCSYNQRQAEKMSRSIRRMVRSRGIAISKDRDTAGDWETEAGGGVRAVGAGAGVASVNADLIIIDDPIGSRDDAESLAHRDRVWDWITNDLLARCEPHTVVLFTMSRWHVDDPAGRLLDRQGDRWCVVDLPGRAEGDDPLGRAEGDPLWPELRDDAWLEEKRIELGEYGFASLIQGRPRPREGGMFKWSWWGLLDDVPRSGDLIRYWDLAGTEPRGRGHDPDFSAGALLCRMPDKRTAIVDVERFRKSVALRDADVERICREDRATYGARVRWWIETEAGIAGKERTAELVRRLQATGMTVHTEHPTGSKIHRAEPVAAAAEAQNILLCPGAWRDPFRTEAADFPNGAHDDQVDAVAGAFSKLATPRNVPTLQTVHM